MKDLILKMLKLNKTVFPYLFVFVQFLFITEVFTYNGFIKEYLFFDAQVFKSLMLFSSALLVLYFWFYVLPKENISELRLFFLTNSLFTLPLIFCYYLFLSIEARHFSNYVFSTFHLQPNNFLELVFSNVLLWVIVILRNYKSVFLNRDGRLRLTWGNAVFGLLFIAFIIFEFQDLTEDMKATVSPVRESFYFLKRSDDARLRHKFGYLYDYANFIKANTPENATILIPPQAYPWPMTGNVLYFRYFLYPRKLVNGEATNFGKNYDSNVKYVLLAKGELKVEEGYDYNWPKFNVPAEKTVYVKEFKLNGEIDTVEVKGSFFYSNLEYSGEWGLIFLE